MSATCCGKQTQSRLASEASGGPNRQIFHGLRQGSAGLARLPKVRRGTVLPEKVAERVTPMLKKRVIPCLDMKHGRVVKGVRFANLVDAGDAVEQARFYDQEGADELVLLDITACNEGRATLCEAVRGVASQVFMPLTVGGGIRNEADMHRLLLAGADKISINTAAVMNPQLIAAGARRFGSQCIVVAVDAKQVADGRWQVWINSGQKATELDAISWAREAANLGAGEILLTSIDRDGTKQGFDLELIQSVADAVPIPVIASGGVGRAEDLACGICQGHASAVLAASIFHFGHCTIAQVKAHMSAMGIAVRETNGAR